MFTQRHVVGAILHDSPLTGESIWVGYYPDLFDENYNLNANCELVKVYPELLKIKIIVENIAGKDCAGYYHPGKKEIVLYNNCIKGVGAVLTHELQHALQDIEKRACGSNHTKYYFKASYFYGDKAAAESLRKNGSTLYLLNKEEKELYKIAGQVLDNYRELEKYYDKDILWLSKLTDNCYKASVGEIEARTAAMIYLNNGTNYNLVEDYNADYLNAQIVDGPLVFLNTKLKFDTSLNFKFSKLENELNKRKVEHRAYLNSFMKVVEEKVEVEVTLEGSLDLIEEHYLNKLGEESHQRMQRPRTNYTKKGRKPAKA